MIKSFRYRMDTGTSDYAPIQKVRVSTTDGLIGYKVKKFQVIPKDPTDYTEEAIVQLWSVEPASGDTDEIDFTSPLLLGVVYFSSGASHLYPTSSTVIFDNVTINQDFFITYKSDASARSMNVYLELEQTKLNLNEATVATLKDMRGRE
jgi:hypothetical protein